MAIGHAAAAFGREQGLVPESALDRELRRLAVLRDREVAAARRRRTSVARTVILRGGTAPTRGPAPEPAVEFGTPGRVRRL